MTPERRKEIALKRCEKLKDSIQDYLEYRDSIPTGFTEWQKIKERQDNIKRFFKASEEEWLDWKWQLRERISDVDILSQLIELTPGEKEEISLAGSKFRWAVVPYYLSLVDPGKKNDPIRLQSIPTGLEYHDSSGVMDPMAEELTSPAPAITRRYPDRLIIYVTNQCATFCRHCQRRRNIGEVDLETPRKELEAAIKYIAETEEIRDVLLTGGDALMLADETLDWLLTELDNIPHVEIKRLGSRVPVTLPYRVTPDLCRMLSKHLPLYLNTQFNHPIEITPDAGKALMDLAKSGVGLGNQAVLLKGINNDPLLMRKLNHELLKNMVKPYYLFHAKGVRGTTHFRTKVEEGIEIMEKLRGYTSGLAIPTYILNAPDGHGKTPMLPQYLISMGTNKLLIRTWEKIIMEYENLD
jgi:glutamate 2,3-aminomutase